MVVQTRSVSVTGPKSTGGCLDECGGDACIEGEPQQVWHYVGPGQGQYDKVERYTPVVGGSWKIEQVNNGGMRLGCCFGWFCTFAAVVCIVAGVVIYRGQVISAVSHDYSVVTSSMNHPALFNCSRGSWTTSLKAQMDQAAQVYRTSLFKQSDTNFDGILGADELSSSSSKLPSCFDQLLYMWDQDGNGLTQGEIDAGLQLKVQDVLDADAEKTFAYADRDCDGTLSLSELDQLRSEASLPKYTNDLLGSADVDADDKLSKLEFVAAMRKSGVATSTGALLGEVWNETKRQWCCNFQAIGCGTYVYDIQESHDCSHGAVELWSTVKREQCCKLNGRGCLKRAVGIYDCYAKKPEEWTFKQRDFCCSSIGRGCHRSSGSYDCAEDLASLKDWSLHKKLFCCDTAKVGCVGHAGIPILKGEPNCYADGLSKDEKTLCCTKYQMGCEAEIEGDKGKAKKAAPAPENTAEEPLYDCRTGWPHSWKSWGVKKQEFCCSNYARGCKDKDGLHAETLHASTVPVIVPGTPHLSLPTVTEPFDCQADVVNWHSWQSTKKSWCCQNKDVACADQGNYDCDAGEVKSWKGAKKDYCCLYQKKGCEF